MVQASRPARDRPSARPLDSGRLRDLALFYVGRFATTEGKLADYLTRKVRMRGWAGDTPPDIAGLTADLVRLGYIDDASFAAARARTLAARGLGNRRIAFALKAARIADDAIAPVLPDAQAARAAAERFARRKRLGPFAPVPPDRDTARRHAAAMARVGHGFDVIRAVLSGHDDDLLDP
jgi:regulatory protein